MIINDEKVGKYCDGVGRFILGDNCFYPHRSDNCFYPHRSRNFIKHPEVIVLDGICVECYKNENNT